MYNIITRRDILAQAVNQCLKHLYTLVQPSVTWEDFEDQCKIYSEKYKTWERFNHLKHSKNLTEDETAEYSLYPSTWENMSLTECIGPKPYEFYYLPKEVLKEVCDSYVQAYNFDDKQNFLDNIETLKNYCKKPIVDKYIDDWTDETGFHHPGYRSYDHPDNLEKEISGILCLDNTLVDPQMAEDAEDYENKLDNLSKQICNKFFEFLDMAGNFYNWNRYLNGFNMEVYLGPSPNSNKEAVIENWKVYRHQDIEINESLYREEDEDYDEEDNND